MLKLILSLGFIFSSQALLPAATPTPGAPASAKKIQWQNHFRGPEQNLTISACTNKGCHYEFKGNPKGVCTDVGQFAFADAEQTTATASHRIGAKTCKFEFTLGDDGSVEVDDSCVCNVANDSDLGGEYKKF